MAASMDMEGEEEEEEEDREEVLEAEGENRRGTCLRCVYTR